MTQEQANVAEKAHIWAFSMDGPRGNAGIDSEKINALENLMLLCHGCHKTIDQDSEGKRYPVTLLQEMKQTHTSRVQRAADIQPESKSLAVLFSARIGDHQPNILTNSAHAAMFPAFYPAREQPIRLCLGSAPFEDDMASFWRIHTEAMEENFKRDLKPLIEANGIPHLSVFGIAPQALLIKLGSILCDIQNITVYQKHRKPDTWAWQPQGHSIEYIVIEPDRDEDCVALNISLSATITNDRIERTFENDVSTWTLTIAEPHNDFLQSEEQLIEFRNCFAQLLNRIKAKHPKANNLHVFPAAPAAANIELGRTWMPKADLDLIIYDQNKRSGGFAQVLNISRS